jgi:hypothetical protein
MTTLSRERRLIVMTAIAWMWTAALASAQTSDQSTTTSLAAVKTRVPIGDVVYVTDTRGGTVKGTLAAVTDEAVQVNVETGLRTVPAADVRRIQWQQRDSPLTGVLIGAGIGASPGLYWLVADPNECTGMCPEEYAWIGIGALVGGLIDRAVHKRVTVYASDASNDRARRVMIGPLITRNTKGVQVAMKF